MNIKDAMMQCGTTNKEEFITKLKQMCPSIQIIGDTIIFPTLQIARAEYDKHSGINHNWNNKKSWSK